MSGALLVAGTASDAGKSAVATGICRWLARRGVAAAPFKAQNMSNNSAVTRDGAEIARPQVAQAAAAGVEPEAAMNPVLLKPGTDRWSQAIVHGRPVGEVSAGSYGELLPRLEAAVREAYATLRARYDVVVCEGAGSPAEINLRARDVANMGLARQAGMPVLVVGDVDRGGMFAAMYGTVALLPAEDQALLAGFVANRFRGDPSLLDPGLDQLHRLTGRPVLGVLPWLDGLGVDGEDSLVLDTGAGRDRPPGEGALQVAVIRFPRVSNFTDLDALACEPGVAVRFVTTPAEVAEADLVVLPGTRATVADLDWLRSRGLDTALASRARAAQPVLGVCGGYQMLARSIDDPVESGAGVVPGLGLLPARASFLPDKTVARPTGQWRGHAVHGYEIRHGAVEVATEPGAAAEVEAFLDGCRAGAVFGTAWHGAFENDGFRREFLAEVAARSGRDVTLAADTCFAAAREARLDALGDAVQRHVDTEALARLIEHGPPGDLPFVPPGAPEPGHCHPPHRGSS